MYKCRLQKKKTLKKCFIKATTGHQTGNEHHSCMTCFLTLVFLMITSNALLWILPLVVGRQRIIPIIFKLIKQFGDPPPALWGSICASARTHEHCRLFFSFHVSPVSRPHVNICAVLCDMFRMHEGSDTVQRYNNKMKCVLSCFLLICIFNVWSWPRTLDAVVSRVRNKYRTSPVKQTRRPQKSIWFVNQ